VIPGFRVTQTTSTVEAAVSTFVSLVSARGLTVFAVIDHAAGAAGAGLTLAPETVIVFGNPAAGTALMQADPRVGLDLPLKILIWEENGSAAIGYTDPLSLADTYDLTTEHPRLRQMSQLFQELVTTVNAAADND
jgi:uncharacterized protein (DUF302 family)